MGNSCTVKIDIETEDSDKIDGTEKGIFNPVTQKDRILLKISWEEIKPKWNDISLVAFRRWFTAYPEIIKLFSPTYPDSDYFTVEELIRSPPVQKHVERFAKMIEKVLAQMSNDENLMRSLVEFGKFHHKIGAKQTYANSLATSLKYAVCTAVKSNVETENAWDSLFRFLSGLLKLGMRQAKNDMSKLDTLTLL